MSMTLNIIAPLLGVLSNKLRTVGFAAEVIASTSKSLAFASDIPNNPLMVAKARSHKIYLNSP